MTLIPPNLSYITIYNPTLKPLNTSDDDEDAEEQAHILFYTSKERAVSRDKVLRQVGLAKALINFSEMFNTNEPCSNIHSQSRRMIMLSPEPDFWIHACVEVAKSVKQPPKPSKGKEKEKPKGQDKQKDQSPQYDYDDSSVHDVALKADIQRGYERFKLTHGSFSSILSNLGREAFELQLDRFWTVWAWSWDLEGGHEFGQHLGAPLHPLFRHIQPILDDLPDAIPGDADAIAIVPPYTIPSTRFLSSSHPRCLPPYLLDTLSPLHASRSSTDLLKSLTSSDDTIRARAQQEQEASLSKTGTPGNSTHSRSGSNTFLGMPDVRKWNWPGYLTFGKSSPKRLTDLRAGVDNAEKGEVSTASQSTPQDDNGETTIASQSDASTGLSVAEPSVDTASLHEAVGDILPPPPETSDLTDAEEDAQSPKSNHSGQLDPEESLTQSTITLRPDTADTKPSTELPSRTPSPEPPQITLVHVNLPTPNNDQATVRQPIFNFTDTVCGASIALVGLKYAPDVSSPELLQLAVELRPVFSRIQEILEDELLKSAIDALPSATKILQPKDRYIISSEGFTLSSPAFTSKSEHLFAAQNLQESSLDVTEVFSRGQNPQHWHVSRKGVFGIGGAGAGADGEVYLEVFRKEASLPDVDNSLTGIAKKFVG